MAEDLGVITPEVEELRDRFGLPGMKVLQFAFNGDADNPYLPDRHGEHSVVYTGTHDNDTTVGWWAALDEESRDRVRSLPRSTPTSRCPGRWSAWPWRPRPGWPSYRPRTCSGSAARPG